MLLLLDPLVPSAQHASQHGVRFMDPVQLRLFLLEDVRNCLGLFRRRAEELPSLCLHHPVTAFTLHNQVKNQSPSIPNVSELHRLKLPPRGLRRARQGVQLLPLLEVEALHDVLERHPHP